MKQLRNTDENEIIKRSPGRSSKTKIKNKKKKNEKKNNKTEPTPPVEVEEDLCAFCLDHIQDPVQLRCMHLFCRNCLALYREARNWPAKRCPLCRRSLDDCAGYSRFKGSWLFKLLLMVVFLLFSVGPFSLLLIYW